MTITQRANPWLSGWTMAIKPPVRLPLADIATREVHLHGSQYGPRYSIDTVPAHRLVFEAWSDPAIKEIGNIAPTGFGKTTIFEVVISEAWAQQPGDGLFIGQNQKMVKDWMEGRMLRVLHKSPWTRDLLPKGKDRHDLRKTGIKGHHMSLYTGGANEGDTQEKSMRYTWGDEIWQWSYGFIGELLKRHHNRWNRKSLLQSQGGDEGSEWFQFCRAGKWHNTYHACPACGEYQPVVIEQLTYGEEDPETGKRSIQRDENGEIDWPKVYDSVRWNCGHCAREFEDTDANRRAWAKNVKAVWDGKKHIPERHVFSHTFLTVWTKEWRETARNWILANEARKRGNLELLKQFINKDLGQFWEEPTDAPSLITGGTPYEKAAYHNGEKWDGEHFRFMTIDVQKGHFWAKVRAWKIGGASRLLWEGKIDTWQSLFHLQERYNVENRCVAIDGRYEIDEVVKQVRAHCGLDINNWWLILIGQDSARGYRYNVGTPKNPKVIWKIYSEFKYDTTSSQIRFRTIQFSNLRAKDALKGQMGLPDGHFGIPTDISNNYVEQMGAESKREFAPGQWRWDKIKDHYHNHLWDCEVMGIVMCALFGVLRIDVPDN